ncbi:hypothetical protein ACJX0J_026929 [Zea mays]
MYLFSNLERQRQIERERKITAAYTVLELQVKLFSITATLVLHIISNLRMTKAILQRDAKKKTNYFLYIEVQTLIALFFTETYNYPILLKITEKLKKKLSAYRIEREREDHV